MEGAARAAKRAFDLALVTAWHTEAFARTKKLPSLGKLLAQSDKPNNGASTAQALAFFHRLKAQGVDVTITRGLPN